MDLTYVCSSAGVLLSRGSGVRIPPGAPFSPARRSLRNPPPLQLNSGRSAAASGPLVLLPRLRADLMLETGRVPPFSGGYCFVLSVHIDLVRENWAGRP